MNNQHSFRAVIQDAGGGGAYVTLPFDVEQVFGKKRVPVHVKWIEEAKREQTRAARVARTVEMVAEGMKLK